MRKSIIITVALTMLLTTACQMQETADMPSASVAGWTSWNELSEAPEAPGASASGDGEAAALSGESLEQALRNAQVLTEHLMNRVFHEGIGERGERVTDRELFYFFTTLPRYLQNNDHPYHDALTVTPESRYIFPEEAVRQIAYELFGFEDWAFDDNMMEYNADAGQYESGLEFGTGANQYSCSDPQAVYLAELNRIEVSFELEGMASIDGDPGWEYLGRYSMGYRIVQENGIFLRFEQIQKAK